MPWKHAKTVKHDSKFYKIVPTAIFTATGLIYLLVPYGTLVAMGLDFQRSPDDHLLFAAVFLFIGWVFWFVNGRNWKK